MRATSRNTLARCIEGPQEQDRNARLLRLWFAVGPRPRGPSGTAPAVDENAGRISAGGVAVHHDVGVTALLKVWIEDRFAGRAPARLPLQQQETAADPGFSEQ
jgi:hypothetical protein